MTDCTERHTPAPTHDTAGEGQKGTTDGAAVTDCTERHTPAPTHDTAGEGQKGTTEGALS